MMRSSVALASVISLAAFLTTHGPADAGGSFDPAPAPINGLDPIQIQEALEAKGVLAHESVPLALPEPLPPHFSVRFTFAGEEHTIDLFRHSVRADAFRVMIDIGAEELIEIDAPAPATYRGVLRAEEGSVVSASLTEAGLTATLHVPGRDSIWTIEPLGELVDGAAPGVHAIYDAKNVTNLPGAMCGMQDLHQIDDAPADDAGNIAPSGGTGLFLAELAWDVDFQAYASDFGSSVNAAVAEVESITNGVNIIYERDAGLTHEITEIVVRTSSESNPYSSSDTGAFLNQIGTEWTGPQGSVQRDLVHVLTGRNIFNENGSGVIGIAFVGVVCSNFFGVGISETFGSNFSQLGLVAHELGHNWSAQHCDGQGDCQIMCAGLGGCAGLGAPSFGTSSINSIIFERNTSSCVELIDTPLAFGALEPVDGTTNAPLELTFDWEPATGAMSYNLIVADNPGLSSPLIDITTSATGFITLSDELAPFTTYYWTVGAINPFGTTTIDGGTRTFETGDALPADFALTAPANFAVVGTTPTLDWEPAANADEYRLEVSTAGFFFPLIIDETIPAGGATEFTPVPGVLVVDDTYFWRVTASNSAGDVSSNPTSSRFSTEADPVSICSADLDGDKEVGFDDFVILTSEFGNGPAACAG